MRRAFRRRSSTLSWGPMTIHLEPRTWPVYFHAHERVAAEGIHPWNSKAPNRRLQPSKARRRAATTRGGRARLRG